VIEVHENRPDGRVSTPETLRLRTATRALRMHLDELPIDFHTEVSGDRFLAGLAFMSARHRYAGAESMIGSGFGGTVIGAMARSLFVDGLRWLWIGEQPERRRALLGDLLEERNGVCVLIEDTDVSCDNLARWLMPLPDVADLTGESLSWLDAAAMPTEEALLDDFLARRADRAALAGGGVHAELLHRTRTLLDMSGLRGAVMVLAHAGHGNFLGLLSSLTENGAVGHDLRADHEALFMQVAAAGVTAALLGTAAAVPELGPVEVSLQLFLERAVELTAEVAAAAVPIHRLDTAHRPQPQSKKRRARQRPPALIRPCAIVSAADLLPDNMAVGPVAKAAEGYFRLARNLPVSPWENGDPVLHAVLAYGGGQSNLEAVMATYDQPGSAVIAVFAARMLLEEGARTVWRYSTGADPDAFIARAKQYFDEFRFREKKAIETLTGSGVPRADARRVFARPSNVLIGTPNDEIARNRQALPKMGDMLRAMATRSRESGWLEVAYSLLSQITHSTPIGQLHTVRVRDGVWHGNELSPEMLALVLDVSCLGSAHVIGTGARVLTDNSADAVGYHRDLLSQAEVVHARARRVHRLD
jgi:hypothetical protein